MAKLDKETIAKLIKLSKINCNEAEQESLYNDLQQIKNIETENDKISYTNVNKINEYKEKLKSLSINYLLPCKSIANCP